MKRFLVSSVAIGLMAGTAMADATYNPLNGTFGTPFDDGQIQGFGFTATGGGGGGGGGLGNLYDNVMTINGGAATGGFFGPFGDIPGTQAFVDWTNSTAQWGDDIHGISAGGKGPAIIQTLYYGYSNAVASTTHIIKIYDMVPPSVTLTLTAFIDKGPVVASIVVAGNPTGAFLVTVTGLNIQVGSAIWIKMEETGPGFPGTFWLTGGAGNGVGHSNVGVTYTQKDYYGPGDNYNIFIPFPSFYFPGTGYVASNVQIALGGVHVPGPAAISLLGLGGLVALRRRRVR
jgi:MYXO-CTERM domain-containing protein